MVGFVEVGVHGGMQSETREQEYSVCRNKQAETEVAGMAESAWTGNGRGKGEPKMMAALAVLVLSPRSERG